MDPDNIIAAAEPHLKKMHEIDGWLSENEALTLYILASSLKAPASAVVEIGSFLGKSSVMIAAGLKDGGTLYCVDPFDKTNQQMYLDIGKQRQVSSLLNRFLANTWPYKNIVPIQAYSHEAHQREDIPLDLDMLFIDGNHNYEAVKIDLELWVPSLRPGGILAMHDVSDKDPGVLKIVNEYGIGMPSNGWCKTALVDTMLITTRTKAPWHTFPAS